MLLLALDTATPRVSVALCRVEAGQVSTLATVAGRRPQQHGEQVAPAVHEVLDAAGAAPADVRAVAVGVGPGPFTGLRVGIVTAAAFADALGVPAYAVGSLDAVAHASGPGEPTVAVLDARRREVYWAAYDAAGERLVGPAVGRPDEVARHPDVARVRRVVGPGADLLAPALAVPASAVLAFPAVPAEAVAALAADRAQRGAPPDPLTPLYLRRPDAAVPVSLAAVAG